MTAPDFVTPAVARQIREEIEAERRRGKRGINRGRGAATTPDRDNARELQPVTEITDYDREAWRETARILAGETDTPRTAETDSAAGS